MTDIVIVNGARAAMGGFKVHYQVQLHQNWVQSP